MKNKTDDFTDSDKHYYTGIIFRGYFEGVGVTVLSGGRYDNLIARFGRDIPAVGFSIKIDSLLINCYKILFLITSSFYQYHLRSLLYSRFYQLLYGKE